MVERGIAVPEVLMRQCRIRFESQSYLDWESPSCFFHSSICGTFLFSESLTSLPLRPSS